MKYNIKAGDTLSKIAKEFNTTVDNLLNSNQSITDPNQISAGQSIEVPGGSYAAAISSGISSLQTGKAWGDVWNAIKKDYGNVANEQIDKDLGVQWREAGAYESYIAQQQGHLPVIKDATPEQIKERIATPEELLEMKAYRQSLKLTPEEEALVPEFDTSYQKPIQKPTEERPKPVEGLRSFFNKFIPESFRAKINKIIDAPEKISQASSFKDVVAETKSVIKEVASPVMQWLNPAVKTITSGFLNKIEDVSQRTLKQRSIESKDKYENGIIDEEDIFDDRYPDKIQFRINANNLLGIIEGQAEDHYKLTDDILKPVMIPDTDKIFYVGELRGNIVAKDYTSYALDQKKYHNLENVSIDKLKESVNKLKELGFNIPDNEYGMPNLENAGSEFEKNRDEFEKILIEKYNLGPTSAMITYNKMTEERKVSINTITSILDKDLSKLTSFDYSDAPDEINQIINDALNSLAADTSTIRQLDKGLKTLNDYNDIYNTNELEYNKAEEQQKELDKKIIKLMSDEIEKWMLAHREIDIMDESKIEKHFEFYNDNKVAIDNLFRLTQEYQDIAEYMNIKAASANRAKERADELDTTTGLSIDKLKPIILDPDFISILSKYAVKAIPGTSDLVEAMKQFSDADEWLVANDSKVLNEMMELDGRDQLAQLEFMAMDKQVRNEFEKILNEGNKITEYREKLRMFEGVDMQKRLAQDSAKASAVAVYSLWKPQATADIMVEHNISSKEFKYELVKHTYTGIGAMIMKAIGALPAAPEKLVLDVMETFYTGLIEQTIPNLAYRARQFYSGMEYLGVEQDSLASKLDGDGIGIFSVINEFNKKLNPFDNGVKQSTFLNSWINQPMPGEIEDMINPYEGNSKATKLIINNQKNINFLAGKYSEDRFIASKDMSILDVVKHENRDQLTAIFDLNDFYDRGIDPYNIPKGTEIKLPKYDQTPSILNFVDSEKRLTYSKNNPIWWKLSEEVVNIVADPMTWMWTPAMAGFRATLKPLGIKAYKGIHRTAKVLDKLDPKSIKTYGRNLQGSADFTWSLLQVLQLKLPDPKFAKIADNTPIINLLFNIGDVPKFTSADLSTLSVLIAKHRGAGLAKDMPWFLNRKTQLTEKEAHALTQVGTVNFQEALGKVMEQDGISSKEVRTYLRDYLIDPIGTTGKAESVAWRIFEGVGLADNGLRKLINEYRHLEDQIRQLSAEVYKGRRANKYISQYYSDRYNSLDQVGKMAWREFMQDVDKSARMGKTILIDNEVDYLRVQRELFDRYPDQRDSIRKAIQVVDEYRIETELLRKYSESKYLTPVQKTDGIEISMMDSFELSGKDKDLFKDKKNFLTVDSKTGDQKYIFDRSQYKNTALPGAILDYHIALIRRRIKGLSETTVGKIQLSWKKQSFYKPHVDSSGKPIGKTKTLFEYVEYDGKNDKGNIGYVNAMDVLHTSYFDWYKTFLTSKQRGELTVLLNKIIDNPTVAKEFNISYRKDFGDLLEETRIGKRYEPFVIEKKKYEFYESYPQIDVLLNTMAALQDMARQNPLLFKQLHDRLKALDFISLKDLKYSLSTQNKLVLWLMELGDGKPNFFTGPQFEIMNLLLRGKKLSPKELEKVISEIKMLGKTQAKNKKNTIINNKLKSEGLSEQAIKSAQSDVSSRFILSADGKTKPDEILTDRLSVIHDMLPGTDRALKSAGIIKFTDEELLKLVAMFGLDEFEMLERIIPRQFTYFLKKKLGEQALNVRMTKYSKELNEAGMDILMKLDGELTDSKVTIPTIITDIITKDKAGNVFFPTGVGDSPKITKKILNELDLIKVKGSSVYNKRWIIGNYTDLDKKIIEFLRESPDFIEGKDFKVIKNSASPERTMSTADIMKEFSDNELKPIAYALGSDRGLDIPDQKLVGLISDSYDPNLPAKMASESSDPMQENIRISAMSELNEAFRKKLISIESIKNELIERESKEITGLFGVDKDGTSVMDTLISINDGTITKSKDTSYVKELLETKAAKVNEVVGEFMENVEDWNNSFFAIKEYLGWSKIEKVGDKWKISYKPGKNKFDRYQESMILSADGKYLDNGNISKSIIQRLERKLPDVDSDFDITSFTANLSKAYDIIDPKDPLTKLDDIVDIDAQISELRSTIKVTKKKLDDVKQTIDKDAMTFSLRKAERKLDQLEAYGKIALPLKVGRKNGIDFTSEEIYWSARDYFTDTFNEKITKLAKLMKKSDDFSKLELEKLGVKDVLYPEVEIEKLSTDWARKKYYEPTIEAIHPREISVPKIDAKLEVSSIFNVEEVKNAIEKLLNFTKDQKDYPTIIDLSGKLKDILKRIMPDDVNKIKFITEDVFINLKRVVPGKGLRSDLDEIAALSRLKELMQDRGTIYIFGDKRKAVTPSKLRDTFMSKAINEDERKILSTIWKHFESKVKAMRPEQTPGPYWLHPKSKHELSGDIIGLDKDGNVTIETSIKTLEKHTDAVVREAASTQFFGELKKSGILVTRARNLRSALKKMDLLILSGENTFLDEAVKKTLHEAIQSKMVFHFPDKMTKGEQSIYSYVKSIKNANIATARVAVTDKTKFPGMLYSSHGLSGSRKSIYALYSKSKEIRIFKNIDEMVMENEIEIHKSVSKWQSNPNKFPPDFVTNEAQYTSTWFKGIDRLVVKWSTISKRKKITEDWKADTKELIKRYRNELTEEMRASNNGAPLEAWQEKLIDRTIRTTELNVRLLTDYVFRFDMPQRLFERMRSTTASRLFYLSEIENKELNITDLELFNDIPRYMAFWKTSNWILRYSKNLTDIIKGAHGTLMSMWIWNILLLRPGWYNWNSLGDAARAIFAVRKIRMFINMQHSYLEITTAFIYKFFKDFITPTAKVTSFSIEKYMAAKAASKNIVLRKFANKAYEESFEFATKGGKSKIGELITPDDIEWATGDGLYQVTADPIYSTKIVETMRTNNAYRRLMKRAAVWKGDIQMFAAGTEQARRQIMVFELLHKKAFTLAEAERATKTWFFDYRDLTSAGRLMRVFFPMYTFNAKMIQLYLKQCIKHGPSVHRAAKVLLESWAAASEDLPDQYKDRVEIGNDVWWMPHFGFFETIKLFVDPYESIKEFIDNPLRMVFNQGWGPLWGSTIQLVQKKGYWDTTYFMKNFDGWWDGEIDAYKKKENEKAEKKGEEGALMDRSTYANDDDAMGVFLTTYLPLLNLVDEFKNVDIAFMLRGVSWVNSKKMRTLGKFFGLNYLEITDISHIWDNMFNLPPHQRYYYRRVLLEENPDLYRYFQQYAMMSKILKIDAADYADKDALAREMMDSMVVSMYYDLEFESPGAGDTWLANNPQFQEVMDKHWETTGTDIGKAIGQKKFEIGSLRSIVNEFLSRVKSADTERIAKMNLAGIDHPFKKAFDENKLREILYDKYGNLKIRSTEELAIVLKRFGLINEEADLFAVKQEAERKYEDWIKLTKGAKEAKNAEDVKYFSRMAMVFSIIPKNIDQMPEEEAQKYWTKWRTLLDNLIMSNPDFKKRYEADLPKWQQEYYEFNDKYIREWKNIIDDDEDSRGFFDKFYSKPSWFRKWYFYKHPNKGIYFPVVDDYVKKHEELRQIEKETGVYPSEKLSEVYNWLWSKQTALKAWDKSKPGMYNSIDKLRQIWDKDTAEDTFSYFDRFYQSPGDKGWDDFREFYLSKPQNEYKRITYPFVREWTALMKQDEENKELGNDTNLASDWFWLDSNAEARKIYGEKNMIDATHSKVDYFRVWKEIIHGSEEDSDNYYEKFDKQEDWFKKNYFDNHPEKVAYYPLAIEISKLEFEDSQKMLFDEKNSVALEAWEKANPKYIGYRRFWNNMSKEREKGMTEYLDYYFKPENAEWLVKHEKNHPGANKAYELWKQYNSFGDETWEERKYRRDFLRSNPELKAWWDRNDTDEEVKLQEKINGYYNIVDSVEDTGKGRDYILKYFEAKTLAKKYLEDNPEVLEFFERPKDDSSTNKLEKKLLTLTYDFEKHKLVSENKDLKSSIHNNLPPGIRKLVLLQDIYFSFEDDLKKKMNFLKLYPELVEYWDIKNLPPSYFTDKDTFNKYDQILTKADEIFGKVTRGFYDRVDKLKDIIPDLSSINNEEEKWLANKLYTQAMRTWATTFGSTMSTYYFRALPKWIRDEYYRRHPDKKYLSYNTLSRALAEGLSMAYGKSGSWALIQQKKYGKNMPHDLKNKVQNILVKKGIWADRSQWSSQKWAEWWLNETARKNNLRRKDMENLPLMMSEARRVAKTYSSSTLPKPMNIYGLLNPFFGGPDFEIDEV